MFGGGALDRRGIGTSAGCRRPAQAPGAGPGFGRGGFAPVVIGPPAPVRRKSRSRVRPAELEQVNAAV